MPKKLTRREAADAAYYRTELPGQLSIDGSTVQPEGPRRNDVIVAGVPERCPDCGKVMTATSGWTALDRSVRAPALQCGACGLIITVSEHAWLDIREAVRARFAELNAPKPKARPKRARGAR